MYIVTEIIETDREGNKIKKNFPFDKWSKAENFIYRRMKEIIKADTLKFIRKDNIGFENFQHRVSQEFKEWLEESDEKEQYRYVASYLYWSCFWIVKEE